MKKHLAILVTLMLLFSLISCGKSEHIGADSESLPEEMGKTETDIPGAPHIQPDSSDSSDVTFPETSTISDEDMFTKNDLKTEYDEDSAVQMELSGEGDVVITEEDTYILSGELKNGSLIVEGDKSAKIRLVFNGVSIENEGGAAIYIKQADKVFITLAENSQNFISNKGEFVQSDDNNVDGAVFSKEDLTFGGSGSLSIASEKGNGVVSKDDLVITGGKYVIDAASHGLEGKDSVRISDGEIHIKSGKDGIHSENSEDETLGFVYIENGKINIHCDGDGIYGSLEVKINGGEIDIVSGDRSSVEKNDYSFSGMWGGFGNPFETDTAEDTVSMKALKAGSVLTVNGGDFKLDSADDALHSKGNVIITDGTFHILTGDDGVHADLAAAISGGRIIIVESYEGIEGETIDISGGELEIRADDDGLNAAGGADSSGFGGFFGGGGRPDAFGGGSNSYIRISGGILNIDADGDGIDSNGRIEVSGGETYVNGPTNSGNGALDYQSGATVSGGIFIAAGARGMAQNFDASSTQGSILVSCNSTDKVTLKNTDGKEIISFTPKKRCDSILISCPELTVGESYILECGGSSSEFTLTSLIYGSGMGGHGGMGGRPGENGGKERPGGRW